MFRNANLACISLLPVSLILTFIRTGKYDFFPAAFLELAEQSLQALPCLAVYPRIIMEHVVGKPGFLGEPLGSEVIGVALRGNSFDRNESLAYEVLDVRVARPRAMPSRLL